MRILFLTLMMSFLSHSAFGAAQKKRDNSSLTPEEQRANAKRMKKETLRFWCPDGYVDFLRSTLRNSSDETTYPSYVSDTFSEASEVSVDFDKDTMVQIHSWLSQLTITCVSDRTLLNKLQLAAVFFVDKTLQDHIDGLLYETYYGELKIDKSTTYKGDGYSAALSRQHIPHGIGEIFRGNNCIFKGSRKFVTTIAE